MVARFREYFNLECLASDYMKMYFGQRSLYSGGSIPLRILNDPVYISSILNTTVEKSARLAHEFMDEPSEEEQKAAQKKGGICRNVELLISILNTCGEMRIPKCFIGGIVLAHLELCEGIRVFERQ